MPADETKRRTSSARESALFGVASIQPGSSKRARSSRKKSWRSRSSNAARVGQLLPGAAARGADRGLDRKVLAVGQAGLRSCAGEGKPRLRAGVAGGRRGNGAGTGQNPAAKKNPPRPAHGGESHDRAGDGVRPPRQPARTWLRPLRSADGKVSRLQDRTGFRGSDRRRGAGGGAGRLRRHRGHGAESLPSASVRGGCG